MNIHDFMHGSCWLVPHLTNTGSTMPYSQKMLPSSTVMMRFGVSFEAEWCIYAFVNFAIIGLDNGLSPVRHQAIILINAGLLLTGPSGQSLSEIQIKIWTFSAKKCTRKCFLQNGSHFVSASMCCHIAILQVTFQNGFSCLKSVVFNLMQISLTIVFNGPANGSDNGLSLSSYIALIHVLHWFALHCYITNV